MLSMVMSFPVSVLDLHLVDLLYILSQIVYTVCRFFLMGFVECIKRRFNSFHFIVFDLVFGLGIEQCAQALAEREFDNYLQFTCFRAFNSDIELLGLGAAELILRIHLVPFLFLFSPGLIVLDAVQLPDWPLSFVNFPVVVVLVLDVEFERPVQLAVGSAWPLSPCAHVYVDDLPIKACRL